MSIFEYVLIPPAIVLGLAMTHLLTGAGRTVHRLAGHGAPIRVDWIHLAWVTHLFAWMVFFWWYTYAWSTAQEWSFLVFAFLMTYAVAMYLLCVVLVPSDLDPVADFGSYFMSLRGWFFGGLAALIMVDFLDSASKGFDHFMDLGWGYITMRLVILAGCAVGVRTDRRAFHGPFAVVALVWTVSFFWAHLPVLTAGGGTS